MGRKYRLLRNMCAALFCLCALLWNGFSVSVAAAENDMPTIIYEDSFDYSGWNHSFFADDGIWSREIPRFEYNTDFTGKEPLVEQGVMKLSEGMSAQFNWTCIPRQFAFSGDNTYTLTFDVIVKDFGDDGSLNAREHWRRELYFAAGGWYNQVEFQSDHAVGCIRTGNLPNNQSVEARAGAKNAEYRLDVPYSVEVVWKPSDGTVMTAVKQGDVVISEGLRTDLTEFTHADTFLSNWVFRCEDGEVWVDNLRFTDGTDIYTQSFDSADDSACMASDGAWSLETFRVEPDSAAPQLSDGVVKLVGGTSIQFNWYDLMKCTYDPNEIYTFAFDFKLTDEGNGGTWGNAYLTRALYVGFGGWYNQIELLGATQPYDSVRAGDSYIAYEEGSYRNQTVHARLVWVGDTITTTLYDSDGKLLLAGSRSSTDYTSMTVENGAMTNLVLRCEDGAVEIDHFSFSIGGVDKNAKKLLDSAELEIVGEQQAVYTCKVNYTDGDHPILMLGDKELFKLNDGGLWLCGNQVIGSYGAGSYGLEITVNPTQKMVSVELTLPDGGVIRRGSCDPITGSPYVVKQYGHDGALFSEPAVAYENITARTYTLNTTEPTAEGFQAKVYNLTTAFDDARTTRSFAWTVLRSYMGEDSMGVRYRLSGTEEWTTAEAQVEQGSHINTTEVYLKADITGLEVDSAYQYQIGKLNSTDSSDWSEVYTFQTASGEVDGFSFVAVGDTQGNSWSDYRPLMLAQAAYHEALEATSDAAFILHAGDVVEDGRVADMWNRFFKALGSYGATIPHFAAIGNHDALQWASEFYFDLHFNHPNNGGTAKLDAAYTAQLPVGSDIAALAQRADETCYSFNYGDAHFIVLNSGTYTDQDRYLLEAQRGWLVSDLEANDHAKWTIVLVHEPVYHRKGGSESRPWLYDVIEGYGVDLVLQGHSHLVTRSYPMKNGAIVTKENPDSIVRGSGTVYTTIGSTTSTHDSHGNPNMEEMMLIKTPAAEQAVYTTVTVTDTALTMTVRQLDGLVVDHFTISGSSEKSGHSYQSVVTDPTCTQGGYTTHTCVGCGDSYVDRRVSSKGHEAVIDEAVAATCTAAGKTEGKHCGVCKAVLAAQDTVPALGHRFASGSCEICGAADPEYVPQIPVVNPFEDVKDADWYYDAVLWAYGSGVTGGTSATAFGPGDGCTRAQVVTFLWAANGKPEPKITVNPFADVKESDWYYKAVLWAVENGITGGVAEGAFGPNQTCTRAQIVTFLYAAAWKPEVSGDSTFSDVSNDAWYVKPVLWAAQNSVTGGIGDGKFGPENTCTRAQVVTFLYKVYG